MMLPLAHTMRHYDWGSLTAFPRLFNTPAPQQPEAELWFGTHPADPSRLADGSLLSDRVQLPYLLKVLAAEKALSIQSHPTATQAEAGFAAENAAGVPLDSPQRNYRDPQHKPELLLALTDFAALCGFRPYAEAAHSWQQLRDLLPAVSCPDNASQLAAAVAEDLAGEDYIAAVERILSGGDAATALVNVVAEASTQPGVLEDAALQTAATLSDDFPGDAGVLMALLLNRVQLRPGQAIFLSAGIMHAYLQGVGVEVMACSDNVLRGGLTPKHIDVAELVKVSHFTPSPNPLLLPDEATLLGDDQGLADAGKAELKIYRPPVSEFQLATLRGVGPASTTLPGPGPWIVLCLAGNAQLTEQTAATDAPAANAADTQTAAGSDQLKLGPGDAVFVSAKQATLSLPINTTEANYVVAVTTGQA